MIIAIIVFLIFTIILIYGNLANKSDPSLDNSSTKISIIVAAKNESQNIPSLIYSLSNQNYQKENYEVIIVDDNSNDSTFENAKINIEDLTNFRILKVMEKKYIGKRGVLQFGIENAQYPNVLITDADCKPCQNWIKEFAKKFKEGYDFIFGIAPYVQNNTLTNKIACFENLRVHILTFGLEGIGLPYSAAARSFGFKKESFEKIKGYQNTTETLSGDDDLLLREAVKHKLKIGIVTQPDAFVFSKTKITFTEYLKQKSRHTSTSNYYSFFTKFLIGLWHILNLLFLFSPFLMFIDVNFGLLFLIKLMIDFILVKLLMKKFGYKFNIFEVLYLQTIYEILLIVNYLKGTFGKREW